MEHPFYFLMQKIRLAIRKMTVSGEKRSRYQQRIDNLKQLSREASSLKKKIRHV
jgi:hypothetical protein